MASPKRCLLNLAGLSFRPNGGLINLWQAAWGIQYQGSWDVAGVWAGLSLLDANGYPTSYPNGTSQFLSIITQFYNSAEFAGPYVLKWTGDGEIGASLSSRWSVQTNVSGATVISGGRYAGTDGHLIINYSGPYDIQAFWNIYKTDRSSTGNYLRNVLLCRLEDYNDWLSDKKWRSAYKQNLIDFNPQAIRFMDALATNNSMNVRFSDRKLPDYLIQGGVSNYSQNVPPYTTAVAVSQNSYTLASATGTPVSAEHGMPVICKFGTGFTFAFNEHPSAITKDATGGVMTYPAGTIIGNLTNGSAVITGTTSSASNIRPGVLLSGTGIPAATTVLSVTSNTITMSANATATNSTVTVSYSKLLVNDKIIFYMNTGMTQLMDRLGTIQSIPAVNQAKLDIDTSAMTTFVQNTGFGTNYAAAYSELNVAGHGAFPLYIADGQFPFAATLSNVSAGTKLCLVLDKSLRPLKDAAGVLTAQGAWLGHEAELALHHGTSIELLTKLIYELNDEGSDTIDMYICIPHMAMMSMDPDYDADENFATNALDVILNGANGYPGLKDLPVTPRVFVEYSNEVWNFGVAFRQSAWCQMVAKGRWSSNDTFGYKAFRTTCMAEDIIAAFPSDLDTIQLIIAGQAAVGVSGGNNVALFGNTRFDTDPRTDGGTPLVFGGDPIDRHDYFAVAYYMGGAAVDYSADITAYYAAVDDAGRNAAIATFVAKGQAQAIPFTIAYHVGPPDASSLLTVCVNAMNAIGKKHCSYEGDVSDVFSGKAAKYGFTGPQVDAFFLAVRNSQVWADAAVTYLQEWERSSVCEMPSVFIEFGSPATNQWAHQLNKTEITSYLGGQEFAGLDKQWFAIADYNNSGTEVQPTATVTFTQIIPDTGTPGDFITSVPDLIVKGTNDALGADEAIEISTNNSTWFAASQLTATTWEWDDPASHSTSFTYFSRVRNTVTDQIGTDHATRAVTITPAPSAATVSITSISPNTGGFNANPGFVTINGTNDALDVGETIQVSVDNGSTWNAVSQNTSTAWTYVDPLEHNTDYAVDARVISALGGVGNTDNQAVNIVQPLPQGWIVRVSS